MSPGSHKDYKELYLKLKEAYSDDNLNRITAGIIDLYKSGDNNKIREITKIVSDYIEIKEEKIHKCFSKLIMIYHPDKGNRYRKEIDHIMNTGVPEKLHEYSHILSLQDFDKITMTSEYDEDIDYHPQYEWDSESNGIKSFSDFDPERMIYDDEDYSDYEYASYYESFPEENFFSAMKRKLYGTTEIDMSSFDLENLEEIEMAEQNIENLDGIEYCKHVKSLDLSHNNISDITGIVNLVDLEELYLQGNQIGLIDVLYNLRKLRIVDISFNNINDVSHLFGLNHLEYVNIMGNFVPLDQIEALRQNEVVVIN